MLNLHPTYRSFRWLFFLLTTATNGQSLTFPIYRQYINEAEYWSYYEHYDTSAQLFDFALTHSHFTPMVLDIYNAAYTAARSNRRAMCIKYLKEASKNRLEWVKYGVFTRDSAIFITCLGQDYTYIRRFIDSLYQHPILSRVQHYKIANDYVAEDQKWVNAKNKDSLNVFHARFLSEIEQNGYPGLIQAGTDVVSIVFLHIREPNYECAYNVLKNAVEAGEATPHELAQMIDYYEWGSKKNIKGVYGCHQCTKITPSDFPEVIQKRLELGVSIFFQKPVSTPWKMRTKVEWFEDTKLLSKFFIFNTIIK